MLMLGVQDLIHGRLLFTTNDSDGIRSGSSNKTKENNFKGSLKFNDKQISLATKLSPYEE